MVYLNLSVANLNSAIDFYANKIGIFEHQAYGRLICGLGVDLIIDLNECGSERHRSIFGRDDHVPASFWISVGDNSSEENIAILHKWKSNHVPYAEVRNLGGHYIQFTDPSSNRFTLHANLGVFQ